jgi:hypothetical protein
LVTKGPVEVISSANGGPPPPSSSKKEKLKNKKQEKQEKAEQTAEKEKTAAVTKCYQEAIMTVAADTVNLTPVNLANLNATVFTTKALTSCGNGGEKIVKKNGGQEGNNGEQEEAPEGPVAGLMIDPDALLACDHHRAVGNLG